MKNWGNNKEEKGTKTINEKRSAIIDACGFKVKPIIKPRKKYDRRDWMRKAIQKYGRTLVLLFVINTNCDAFFCDFMERGQTLLVSNQTLLVSDQTLLVSNQTLLAFNQTLLVSNQTLSVSNQTLLAFNQTLLASNQTLLVSNQTLLVFNQTLSVSNQTLLVSNQTLLAFNQTLLVSNQTLLVLHKVTPSLKLTDCYLKMSGLIKLPICFTEEYCLISSIISQRFRLPLPDV